MDDAIINSEEKGAGQSISLPIIMDRTIINPKADGDAGQSSLYQGSRQDAGLLVDGNNRGRASITPLDSDAAETLNRAAYARNKFAKVARWSNGTPFSRPTIKCANSHFCLTRFPMVWETRRLFSPTVHSGRDD